jgi:hypothetical protein
MQSFSVLRRPAGSTLPTQGYKEALHAILLIALLTQPLHAAMTHDTPDTHLTIFEDLGDMVADSAYIHVLVPVNINNFSCLFDAAADLLVQHIHQFRNSTTFYNEKWYDSHYDRNSYLTLHPGYNITDTNGVGISIGHQIYAMQRTFANLTAMLPASSQHQSSQLSRQKRIIPYLIGLAAAAIIGAILGTYFGPYSQTQINTLPLINDMDMILHVDDEHHELLDKLHHRVNTAFKVLKAHENDYKNINNHLTIWYGIVQQLQHRLEQFTAFVTQLQHRRLSMTWFTNQQLLNIHNSVIAQAQRNNLHPLTQHLSDYFQLDVSYVKKDNFITAILHIPASSSDDYYKVYRYVPFPIPLPDSHVMTIHAREEIIAVGHNNLHRVLTQTQLNNCNRHYQKYICETPFITNTNFSTSCVGALMDHNAKAIQAQCSLQTSAAQESVFQLAHNQFAIYSPETFTGRGKCLNGSSMSALVSTITKVMVPPGCSFNLRHHVLQVPINVFTSSEPWVQETKWDTLEVPRQLLLNDLRRTNAIHQLLAQDEVAQQEVTAQLNASAIWLNSTRASVAHHAATIKYTLATHQWYIYGLAALFVAILLILCVCACKRYNQAATVMQTYIPSIPMATVQHDFKN